MIPNDDVQADSLFEELKSPGQQEEENKYGPALDPIAEQDRALEHMVEIADVLKAQAVAINNVIEVVEDAKGDLEAAVVLELDLPKPEEASQEAAKVEEAQMQLEEKKVEEVEEVKVEEVKEGDVKEEDKKEPEDAKQSQEGEVKEEPVAQEQPVVQEQPVAQEQPASQNDPPVQEGTVFGNNICRSKRLRKGGR